MSRAPVRVVITGAAGQIGYQLSFRIASGQMLGAGQPVILQLLEITPALGALEGVVMELHDAAFPLLHDIVATDGLNDTTATVTFPSAGEIRDTRQLALEEQGIDDAELRARLLQLYWELSAYPEVPEMLAALKAVGESVEKPLDYFRTNIAGFIQLMQQLPQERHIIGIQGMGMIERDGGTTNRERYVHDVVRYLVGRFFTVVIIPVHDYPAWSVN